MKDQSFSSLARTLFANSRNSTAAFTSSVRAVTRTPNIASLLLFSIAALVMGGTTAVRGQSALDGFDPNANGAVHIVVAQPDGKILIAGDFATLAPNGGAAVTRNLLARLNPDGTLDTAFNPNPNGGVLSITLQSDGNILVGGNFASIGGQPRHRIARLDAFTGAADSFDPNPAGDVYAVAVQADGKVLAGGAFTSIGGQMRNGIARLDPTTGLADSFDPNAQGIVQAIAVQPDGKILVGGTFTGANSIGGQSRNHIARLDPTTGLADAFAPDANGRVVSIAAQADGKLVVGGQFDFIGGQTRKFIARLDPTTGAADAFNPNANSFVYSIAVQTDGRILAGGLFNGANSIGGQARNYIARLDPATGLADAFDPNVNGAIVFSIAVQYDGKIVAGGNFTSLSPSGGGAVTRNNIARLEKDGLLDRTLDLGIVGSSVPAIAVQPDGKILIGGIFSSVLGVTRNNMARLNTDGTLDAAFDPNANGAIHSIVVQGDGQILVGGEFHGPNSIGGATRNYIARLGHLTGVADSFNPNASATVFSMAVQADGKILACGTFTNIGGLARNYLTRLDANGTTDAAFNPNPNSDVETITVQGDGKIFVGGNFTSIGGQPRNRIAQLDATSGLAGSWDPNADSSVTSIVLSDEGLIFVGGSFTNIGGAARRYLARVYDLTGVADVNFIPDPDDLVLSMAAQEDYRVIPGGQFTHIAGQARNHIARLEFENDLTNSFDPNANYSVTSLGLQADGKILAGGQFNSTNSIGGQTRNYFARLSNDIAAFQYLQGDAEFVTWFLSGANPQFMRVTFEYSTNNVNYTFLGNGVQANGLWSFPDFDSPGLKLPTQQNIYIRARGYYSSGNLNGSGSIMESVRNVFIPPPPRLNIQRSGNRDVVLSWSRIYGSGFVLEATTNLNANVWGFVYPQPVVSGTNNVVTNTISGSALFYRLRQSL